MATPNDEQKLVRDLFDNQMLGVLATQDGLQPHTSLIAFVASDDLKNIFFTTSRATRKFSNLQANPQVAVLVDSRSRSVSDFHEAIAVTVYGRASEESKEIRGGYLEHYLSKHPHLEEFASAHSTALVKITVEKYSIVSHFQNVRDLVIER